MISSTLESPPRARRGGDDATTMLLLLLLLLLLMLALTAPGDTRRCLLLTESAAAMVMAEAGSGGGWRGSVPGGMRWTPLAAPCAAATASLCLRLAARQALQNLRHLTFCVLVQPPGPWLHLP